MNVDLRLGDCLEVLKTIPDNSVDSIVTDPPYHLTSIVKRFGKEGSAPAQFGTDGAYSRASKGFMGKEWDGGDIAFRTDVWEECLRILKPGGHLLAFSHSRTYHRMGVAIEDAGFEIRDQIMYIYGSGFPKSHNIGKALDKIINEKERTEQKTEHDLRCVPYSNLQETEGELYRSEIHKMSEGVFGDGEERWIHNGTPISDVSTPKEITNENGGSSSHRPQSSKQSSRKSNVVSEQLTSQEIREIAQRYNNFGSALKPAHEPIVMARKPLSEKSIAENVLKHGTGGINIDGSRIGSETRTTPIHSDDVKDDTTMFGLHKTIQHHREETNEGRFPANIIFDEEAGQLLDEQSGKSKTKANKNYKHSNTETESNTFTGRGTYTPREDEGGASRFFYCPKASKKDRNEGLVVEKEKNKRPIGVAFNSEDDLFQQTTGNNHPTVKPTDLMRYLINLITPPNGTTLDPFMGSGSTGKAAVRCGVNFIGIEREQEYMDIAKARIKHEQNKPIQTKLF